jgi:hypothetical protein
MDITLVYAIGMGSIFCFFMVVNRLQGDHLSLFIPAICLPRDNKFLEPISLWVSKKLTYPYLIQRHRFLGPWSRAGVLVHLIYIAVNGFCLGYGLPPVSIAGVRAGTLSLANLIPLFSGLHLSFLADLLGVSLSTYRLIHRSMAFMSFGLALFHVLVGIASDVSFSMDLLENRFAVVVSMLAAPCIVLKLTSYRPGPQFACSFYSHILPFELPGTNYFSAPTKH